jgi:rRNA-processing protein FCF1
MILLDTNVVLEYKKLKLFFRKRELAITKPCLEEIKKLAKKDKVLLSLVNSAKIIETDSKRADDSIIEAAKKCNLKVATFDKILIKKLEENKIPVLESDKEILRELS